MLHILILGADGMLGNELCRQYHGCEKVTAVLHSPPGLSRFPESMASEVRYGLDVRNEGDLARLLAETRPDWIVNTVGVVKQRIGAREALPNLEINAVYPHKLSRLAQLGGARVVHVSTDCVFAGDRGGYSEDDRPDASDIYGQSKHLGEITYPHCVTIRSSIIGLELARRQGLVEWLLSQQGQISGYRQAIFSGLTTMEMARLIRRIMDWNNVLGALWHVAAAPISKYDLIRRLCERLDRKDIDIIADDQLKLDRSLDGSRFSAATGYEAPSWDAMLDELTALIQERNSSGGIAHDL